jgi:hypothetical protein
MTTSPNPDFSPSNSISCFSIRSCCSCCSRRSIWLHKTIPQSVRPSAGVDCIKCDGQTETRDSEKNGHTQFASAGPAQSEHLLDSMAASRCKRSTRQKSESLSTPLPRGDAANSLDKAELARSTAWSCRPLAGRRRVYGRMHWQGGAELVYALTLPA